jgi:long-chain acyl-CoA synthetase
MNLAQLLVRASRTLPDRAAVRLGDHDVLSYGQLAQRSAGLGTGFRDRVGLTPGDRVLILMANESAYLEALFACWWGGFTAVPVNAKLHPREVSFILRDSDAGLVLTSAGLREVAGDALIASAKDCPVLVSGDADWERLALSQETGSVFPSEAHDPAWLLHQRYDRNAQGRRALPSQSDDDDRRLSKRRRPDYGSGFDHPRGTDVTRLRPLRAAARRRDGGSRGP